MKKEESIPRSIYLPRWIVTTIQKMAKEENRSFSYVAARLLTNVLKKGHSNAKKAADQA